MNADGSGRLLLTPNAATVTPAWSPDGRRIAFSGGEGSIWVVNVDGSGERRRLVRSRAQAAARRRPPMHSHQHDPAGFSGDDQPEGHVGGLRPSPGEELRVETVEPLGGGLGSQVLASPRVC
jgi:hypothetical protein